VGFDSRRAMISIALGCLEPGRQRTPAQHSAASEPQERGASIAVLRHTPLEDSTSFFSEEKTESNSPSP
jgi:hypothetical protein